MEFTTKLALTLGFAGLIIIETGFIIYGINEVQVQENKSGYVLIFGNVILLLSTMIKMMTC